MPGPPATEVVHPLYLSVAPCGADARHGASHPTGRKRRQRRGSPNFAPCCFAIPGLLVLLFLTVLRPVGAQVVLTPGTLATTAAGSGKDVAYHSATGALTTAVASPNGIAVDASGDMYVADTRNHVVLRIAPDGTVALAAGNGQQGYSGDGAASTQARLDSPTALAIASDGSLLIADTHNHAIRRVDSGGVISTLAGTGKPGYAGDDAPGTPIQFRSPRGLAVAANGDVYIADSGNHRIRVLHRNSSITTVAGSGAQGSSGNGGPALLSALNEPGALAFTSDGRLLIADGTTVRVLLADGTITTLSGAASAGLRRVSGLAQDSAGNIVVADAAAQRLLAFSNDGTSLAAGTGVQGSFAEGPATNTPLDSPSGIAISPDGSIFFGDRRNHRVERVRPPVLDFGQLTSDTTAAPQTFTLTNSGSEAAQILAVMFPAPFSAAGGTCPAVPFALAAGSSCSISVGIIASTTGAVLSPAYVRVAGQAPQAILLSATILPPGALASTTTSLAANGSTVYTGMPVSFTATVHSSGASQPSGTVSIYDGPSLIASSTLASGTAQWTTSSLSAGQHQIHAAYSGDANDGASTSATITETVAPQPDYTFSGAASSPGYTVAPGGTVAIPLTLQPVNGVLQSGVSFTVSGLPSGATASFNPNPANLGSSPQTVTLTLQMPASSALAGGGTAASLLAGVFVLMFVRKRGDIAPLFLLAMACATLAGCGTGGYMGGSSASSTSGASGGTGSSAGTLYSVVVTAHSTGVTGQPLTHTCTITLVATQ